MDELKRGVATTTIIFLLVGGALLFTKWYQSDIRKQEADFYKYYGLSVSNVVKDEKLAEELNSNGAYVESYWLHGDRLSIYKYKSQFYARYYDHSGILVPENYNK